jgi:hypothetical protein
MESMKVEESIKPNGEIVRFIPRSAWEVDEEQRKKNVRSSRRSFDHNPECKMCGRKISVSEEKASHVLMSVYGDLHEVTADLGSDSQGFFPVGTECAKKIPAMFRIKWSS